MADENVNDLPIPDGDEESLRQQQDTQAAERARQSAEDAEKLRAEEHPVQPLQTGGEEQPFGNRKDDEGLLAEREGTAPGTTMQTGRPAQAGDALADGDATGETPPDDASAQGLQTQASPLAPSSQAEDPTTSPSTPSSRRGAETPADDVAAAAETPEPAASGEPSPEQATAATSDAPFVPTAQTPTLEIAPARGLEDGTIALNIQSALADSDQGAETLSIRISGVPDGASLSAGVDLGEGIWELAAEQLDGLSLNPPPDSNDDFTLTVTATSTESNGATATIELPLPVDVVGVADAPTISIALGSGTEDSSVPLEITGSLTDVDGSESLTFLVSDIPAGATLSAGTDNGDGTWTLEPGDLPGLLFTPPADYSGTIGLTVSAIATENDGDVATTSATTSGTFTPVADAPEATVSDAVGSEDGTIALDVQASLLDTDGSETLGVVVSGLPDGATLSAGTDNGDGSWTLDPADLDGLTVTPPDGFSGEMALTVSTTATEADGTSATTTSGLSVQVAGVADAPTLSAADAAGAEDTAVPLDIRAALTDVDGSETLGVTVTGVPDGFTLSAGTDNGDGTWTLDPADLAGLAISAPQDYSGTFELQVAATSTEADGDSASTGTALSVTFTGVADEPRLTAEDVTGTEDAGLPLNLAALATDADGSETITAAVISGVPDGFTLSVGTDLGGGQWSVPPGSLGDVVLHAPEDYSGSLDLGVTVTATDSGGDSATRSAGFSATFAPDPDAPVVGAASVGGDEDSPIALGLSSSLTDVDGSETLGVVVSGVPDGATLSHGTDLGGGRWAVAPADLADLTLTPPADFSGDIAMQITATATESDGTTASTAADFTVSVAPVADAASFTAALGEAAEDQPMDLNISGALADTDGSETLSYEVANVPDGFTLTAGTDNGDGTWTLTPADLAGLQLVPPADFSGDVQLAVTAIATESDGSVATTQTTVGGTFTPVADAPEATVSDAVGSEDGTIALDVQASLLDTDGSETLGVVVSGLPDGATLSAGTDNGDGSWTLDPADLDGLTVTPPEHFSGTLDLRLLATSTDANGDTATTTLPLRVDVAPVADAPTLTTAPLTGTEDVPLQLGIGSALVDADGSETLALTVSGIPDGFSLSAGTDNGDGSWTLAPAQLEGLTMSMPQDYKGGFDITVTAASTEAASGETAAVTRVIPVTVNAVADAPILTVTPADTQEDASVALTIDTSVADVSGSENISAVIVSGLPDGATLSAGTDNGDGSWTLAATDLSGLVLHPPADSNVDFTLTVTSIAEEPDGSTAQTVATLPIGITGVADTPTLTTQDASGNEDRWIRVRMDGGLGDADSSESLHFDITGLPPGAQLNHGTQNSDGSWSVDPSEVGGLYVRPPHNYSGTFELTATAVATEDDGDTATISAPINITVNAVADSARAVARDAVADEDNDVQLSLEASVRDSSEVVQSTIISGVPDGFTVVGGTDQGGGEWSVPPDGLGDIWLRPPQDYSGTVDLTFQVITLEPENGSTRTTTRSFDASFEAVADAPILAANDVTTLEDTPVQLDLAAQVADIDFSETLGVVVSGVPAGASLSAGTDNGDGTWTIDPAELGALTLQPPEHFSGDIALRLTATSTESSNSDVQTLSADFTVHVTGVADTPELAVVDVLGNEDSEVALTVRAALADTDGSESLFVEFSGVPEGATLSTGTRLPNGNWLVPSEGLATLTLTPPTDSNEDFTLTARSLAVEADGDRTYSAPQTIGVSLRGVPDAPAMTIGAARGDEDTPIPLNFQAESTDTDTSESISYVITGVPQGASLSSGVFIGDGRWSVGEADMPSLTVTPPQDYSGTFELGVSVVVQENDGRESRQDYTLPVTVDPVIDQPDRGGLSGPASYGTTEGLEDTAIALNIDPGLTDTDGSETVLWAEISGVPAGATLSAGTEDPDSPGVFRISPEDFAGLTITPPENSDVDFDLNVRAMIQEIDGSTAISEGPLHVVVHADADAPILTSESLLGLVNLGMDASLTDTDGSESLSFIISGLLGVAIAPSAGINLGGGSYLVTEDQLTNLSFHSDSLAAGTTLLSTVHAISTEAENGDTATNSGSFLIQVSASVDVDGGGSTTDPGANGHQLGHGRGNRQGQGVAHGLHKSDPTTTDPGTVVDGSIIGTPPSLEVAPPTGSEDQAFGVSITPDFGTGGSLYGVIISDLPEGARPNIGFYNPVDDQWIIAGDDSALLQTLEITPPEDYAGPLDFTVTLAKTGEDGLTQETSTTVTAVLDPVADGPRVGLGNPSGTEDTPLDIDLRVVATDADGSEQIVSVVIGGLPEGASLTGVTDLGDGRYEADPANLDHVRFIPPADAHGEFSFTVETVMQESDGSQSTFSRSLGVTIAPEVDPATLTTASASGLEDGAIALTVGAELSDTDGSETLSVTISDVPADALFSAGSNNGDGSWTFTPEQLNGLTFTPPPNADGSYTMTLNAYAMESSTGQLATTSQTFTVDVAGMADQVPVDSQDTLGAEDRAIAIELEYTPVDLDGSETVTAVLTGIPAGSSLSAGVEQSDGSWIMQGAGLAGLTLTPPNNFSGDIAIHADVVTTERSGDSATTGTDFTVTVTPVADAPELTPQQAVGEEDTAIPLDLQAVLTDSGEDLVVTVSGVPDGATLSAGTHNPDGSWTLGPDELTGLTLLPAENQSGDFTLNITATSTEPETGESALTSATLDLSITPVADAPDLSVQPATGDEDTSIALDIQSALADDSEVLSITISGVPVGATLSVGTQNPDGSWTLAPDDLSGLTLTPAENQSGEFALTVTATSTDGASLAETSTTLNLSVIPVADAPNLTVLPAVGLEDTEIALDIQTALLDTSEILTVTIDGVPTDATLSAGTHNPDGSWSLTSAELDGLRLIPAENQSGDYTLTVTATALDGAAETQVTADLNLSILPVADAPTLNVLPVVGLEDTPIALNIQASLLDSSELLEVTVGGLPVGAALSAGTDNGDGSWTLSAADLVGLTLTPPADSAGDFDLTVTATSLDGLSRESTTATLSVEVLGDPDAPTFTVLDASGTQDQPVALVIEAQTITPDETLSLTISGVPEGGSLSSGTDNGDGSWSLAPEETTGLLFNPPEGYSGTLELEIVATVEQDGTTISQTELLGVDIEALDIGLSAESLNDAQLYANLLGLETQPEVESDSLLAQTLDHTLNGQVLIDSSVESSILEESVPLDGDAAAQLGAELLDPQVEQEGLLEEQDTISNDIIDHI